MSRLRAFARRPTTPLRRFPRASRAVVAAAAPGVVGVLLLNLYVILSAGESADDVEDVPHARVAIVLGAQVHEDGRLSSMLQDRVDRAFELWEAGKVDKILVSGDHGDWVYDEPDTMRFALEEAGVPPSAIFTDHAGFDTWATMKRAREVFGVDTAVVVTQDFHLPRALYLADAAGLDATGFSADSSDYGRNGIRSAVREWAGRVKAVGDTVFETDVTLGEPVPITGDGRASWGPAPPPGTPPAGAPRS